MTDQDIHILGLESSCDETSAAIVTNGTDVRSNIIATQHELHEQFGGVVPEIASRAHVQKMVPTIEKALADADMQWSDIHAVAVGNRPGLIGSLLIAVSAAKTLAWSLQRPLIGIDHIHAHLYAGALDGGTLQYPALGLAVSGGHTSLYLTTDPMHVKLLGKTIDDAVGEAYDKVANMLALGYPGGPRVDKLAAEGDPEAIRFPRTMLDADSLDFSFSGLKTAVLYHVRGKPSGKGANVSFQRSVDELSPTERANVAAGFQAAAVDVLMAKVDRARTQLAQQRDIHVKTLVVGGGVSANSRLRQALSDYGKTHQINVNLPKLSYCLDNAAMIAGLAYHYYREHRFDDLSLQAIATGGR